MLIWDNQQATGYFIGILDGEGCYKSKETGYKAIEISNDELDIIEECERFLSNSCVLFRRYEYILKNKIRYKIIVSMQDCINLYNKIKDKLECRIKEYQKILNAPETERDLTIDYNWLVGIYEAEGAIILSENYRGNLTPKIELDNTNEDIIYKIRKNLDMLKCSYYVKDYDRGNKPFTKISIQGIKRCKRFLESNIKWRSKKITKKCSLLLDYCNLRLSKTFCEAYSQDERNLKLRFSQING